LDRPRLRRKSKGTARVEAQKIGRLALVVGRWVMVVEICAVVDEAA